MRRRLRGPLWFHLAVVAGWVTICHLLDLHALEGGPVQQAFLGWLIVLGEIIWNGIQATATAVVAYLAWAVNALFWLGQVAYNALIELAHIALRGVRAGWRFFRWTYDEILAPAWRKFWHLVDVLHHTLDRVFGPVFRILRRVRDEILAIYTHWVRPVLDTIAVTRQMLRVLSALHIGFAKRLDAKLGDIEAAIDRPFRYVLGKLNDVINVVNRIVTLDGALQRLVLVRTLARDWTVIGSEYAKWHKPPLTADELAARAAQKYDGLDPASPGAELGKFYRGDGGEFDGIIRELVPEWRIAAGLDQR